MRFVVAALGSLLLAIVAPACSCSDAPGGGGPRLRDGGTLPDGAHVNAPDSGDPASTIDSAVDAGPRAMPDAWIDMTDAGPGCGPREICNNGLDDNCNGQADEGCGCSPGQTQSCYNGPTTVAGVGQCRRGMQTCDVAGDFGTWTACSGQTDPGTEVCDGTTDEDCDGTIDEGCGCPLGTTRDCYTAASSTEGVGPCHGGSQTCVAMGATTDWGPCGGEVTPQPEVCDGMDYDCDGVANTGCVCALGSSRSCYDGPTGTSGVGICHDGAQSCVAATTGTGAMWGSCDGEVTPQTDRCDGIDYTCTGVPGAGCACILGATRACYGGPPATRGVGRCHDGTNTCVSGPTWSPTCAMEQQPVAEICSNSQDDDCDALVDEGCGGTIMCPGHQTVLAGQPIVLSVTSSGISTYSWQILSAPTGGAAVATWAPNAPTAMTETFTPYIVGDYLIQVNGTDAGGRVVTCTFTVTALPHGMRVQLTWDGTGDLDLHVHNQVTSSPWFNTTNDCFYSDRTPAWGASLDFDNTSQNGPENVSMDTPAIGVPYTVAVHNYSRGAGRTATIQIFCGSTSSTVPNATYTSRALAGTAAGNCTANDFWTVATVTFTSATTCTINTVNTYRQSSAACSAY